MIEKNCVVWPHCLQYFWIFEGFYILSVIPVLQYTSTCDIETYYSNKKEDNNDNGDFHILQFFFVFERGIRSWADWIDVCIILSIINVGITWRHTAISLMLVPFDEEALIILMNKGREEDWENGNFDPLIIHLTTFVRWTSTYTCNAYTRPSCRLVMIMTKIKVLLLIHQRLFAFIHWVSLMP